MDALLDMGGRFWPEHHRCLADTLWSNSPPAQQLATVRDCLSAGAVTEVTGAMRVFHRVGGQCGCATRRRILDDGRDITPLLCDLGAAGG